MPGQENNSNNIGLNPLSSKIGGKVSHLIEQDQVPDLFSGLKINRLTSTEKELGLEEQHHTIISSTA